MLYTGKKEKKKGVLLIEKLTGNLIYDKVISWRRKCKVDLAQKVSKKDKNEFKKQTSTNV